MNIDWKYVLEQIDYYSQNPSDYFLYDIGIKASVLTFSDAYTSPTWGNTILQPEQRYRVLNWITGEAKRQIDNDLALLIFGRAQLSEWLEISRRAYPDFEFYLVFEAHDGQYTGNHGIDFAMYWMPRVGAPQPDKTCDFSWKLDWEWGEMFWGNYPGGTTNEFDFTLAVYPDQESFARPGWFCEEGDRYCTPDEEEAQMMSVAEVLEATQVAA